MVLNIVIIFISVLTILDSVIFVSNCMFSWLQSLMSIYMKYLSNQSENPNDLRLLLL